MSGKVKAILAGLVLVTVALWWWAGRPPPPPAIELLDEKPDTRPVAKPVTGATRVEALRKAATVNDGGAPKTPDGRGRVVAEFGWGNGEGKLGKTAPEEANPEAPMSLTVDALGNVWILDQVNNRLVKVDKNGKPLADIELPLQAAQDVAVTADGTALVMDRLVDKAVAVIGPDGKQKGELPLEGKGLEEGGASTGLFADGDDVYVEREHGDSVRIGDSSGKADTERPEVPGRPAGDNKTYLTAGITNGPAGLVAVTAVDKATQQHRFTRQLVVGAPVVALNLLDADLSGIIYLGTVVFGPNSTPEVPEFAVTLLCLDPVDGAPLAGTSLPTNSSPEETFRELQVVPEGGVLMLVRSPAGAQLVHYQCGQ